jgi:hypothetical protein
MQEHHPLYQVVLLEKQEMLTLVAVVVAAHLQLVQQQELEAQVVPG